MELANTKIRITCAFNKHVVYNRVLSFNYGNSGYYWLNKLLKENQERVREELGRSVNITVKIEEGEYIQPLLDNNASVSKSVRDYTAPICNNMNKALYLHIEKVLKESLRDAQKRLVSHQSLRREYLK